MFSLLKSYALQHLLVHERPSFSYYFTQITPNSFVLSRFCWAESYVDYLLPATECKLNIWTTEAASETEERERAKTKSRTPPLDVLKLWNSERFCTSLVSPRTFFFCTHIHTSFPTKPCLNDSYLFWTTKKNFYLNNEGKKVKETISNLLTMTNRTELFKGNMDVKSPTRTKQTF